MGEIVTCVEQVFDMIQTIATSTEEQSATAEDVNRNMVSINDITRQLSASVNDIKGTSESFARLASELNQMVSWFKL
jgi:methyl-accepting chemotaxis protein